MRTSIAMTVALLTAACAGEADPIVDSRPTTGGERVPQLEDAHTFILDGPDPHPASLSTHGLLSVTDENDRNFTLSLQADEGLWVVAVHASGGTDLRALLHGREVDLQLSYGDFWARRTLLLEDDAGPLYALDIGFAHDWVDGMMDRHDFADWGEIVATWVSENYETSFTEAIFQSDNGPVALLPGEADAIAVGGILFRVVPIEAYLLQALPNAPSSCSGSPQDKLSFELTRIDAPVPPSVVPRGHSASVPSCN